MSILEALILGMLQGVAEFLPISSSGHLVLVPWWLGWEAPPLVYDVVVHVGTMSAILIFFWRDWFDLTLAGWQALKKRAITEPNEWIFFSLIIGTIPAVIVGLLLEDIFEEKLSEPRLVAVMLLVTAALLVVSELLSQFGRKISDIKLGDGLLIGVAQAVAIVPGISRSGSTIAAGLLRGLDRESAARYSFLLATPVIIGAGAKQALDIVTGDVVVDGDLTGVLIVGYVSSAIVGYASIAFLLRFIRRRSLYPFAIYCVIFGTVSFIATFIK